jgi:hypothetical protein
MPYRPHRHKPDLYVGGHSGVLDWLIHGFPLVLNLGSIDLGSINFGTVDLLDLLGLGNSQLKNAIRPFLELMGSPASGVAWGTTGTVLSPIAQFSDDGVHIADALQGGDVTTAFEDLLNMPINTTNAFFEGYGNAYTLLEEVGIGPILGTTPQLDVGGLFTWPACSEPSRYVQALSTSSRTRAASACPLVAFITAPTIAPAA